MVVNKKQFRYFYWIAVAFFRKNAMFLSLSFVIGIIIVVLTITIGSRNIVYAITSEQIVVGIAGSYDLRNIPQEIEEKISTSLIYVDENGNIVPGLAKSWETNEDGTEYRFYLRNDISWNDDTPFTSQDVNYTFNDVLIEKPDPHVIVFKLSEPLPIFPTYLEKTIIKYPLVGIGGPYRINKLIESFGSLEEIHLAPKRPGDSPYIYKFYPNETDLINAYKLGEITQFSVTKKSIADQFERWNNTKVERRIDYSQLLTLFFNMDNMLLQERDARRAIAMSMPMSEFESFGERAYGPIPPTSWAYNDETRIIQENQDLAKDIFENYNSGTESAKLTISTFVEYLPIAEDLEKSLDQIGIDASVNVSNGQMFADYDMLLANWIVPEDPDQYFFWHSTQEQGNISNYKNVRIDKLLEDGRSTLSRDERRDYYDDFQRVMVDDLPAHFLYYPYLYIISRN